MESNIEGIAAQASEATAQLVERVTSLTITSVADYEFAAEELKAAKSKAKELDEKRKELTRPLDESKKKIMALFKPAIQFCEKAEATLKRTMLAWDQEQARIAREEQARQRELARKEQEKLERAAAKAEKAGRVERAEDLRTVAASVSMPVVAPEKANVEGISKRTLWSANVTDKLALIQAVARGQVPHAVLEVNMKVLNAQARALTTALDYPGVEAVTTETMAARS